MSAPRLARSLVRPSMTGPSLVARTRAWLSRVRHRHKVALAYAPAQYRAKRTQAWNEIELTLADLRSAA